MIFDDKLDVSFSHSFPTTVIFIHKHFVGSLFGFFSIFWTRWVARHIQAHSTHVLHLSSLLFVSLSGGLTDEQQFALEFDSYVILGHPTLTSLSCMLFSTDSTHTITLRGEASGKTATRIGDRFLEKYTVDLIDEDFVQLLWAVVRVPIKMEEEKKILIP